MARKRHRSHLGQLVFELREAAGLEQSELAAMVGTDQPRISDLEGSPEHLERLLNLLAAIDEACGRERGTLLTEGGWVSRRTDTYTTIITDPHLDDAGRGFLAGAYQYSRAVTEELRAGDEAARQPTAEELAAIGPPFDDEYEQGIWEDPVIIDKHRRYEIWHYRQELLAEAAEDGADDRHRRAS